MMLRSVVLAVLGTSVAGVTAQTTSVTSTSTSTATETPSATATVAVVVPVAKPTNAAFLSQNLIGFSLESDRWPDWAGIDAPNTYWLNTLKNMRALTGKPPKIRVGANSEDRTVFVESQTVPTIGSFPNWTATAPYPEAVNNTIGPSFYTISKHLLAGTRMTWGLNLGRNDSANAIAEANSIAEAFASPALKHKRIVLELIEAGNEPDLYKNNGLRNRTYTIANWETDWVAMADAVSTALGYTKGSLPGWLIPSFATSDHGKGAFSPQQAFKDGLLATAPGSLATAWNQHWYSGSFCQGSAALLGDLMSKPYIRGNITQFSADIAATRAQGLPYWFGETNSYSCHGSPGVSNSAGAALWVVDYTLQAASQHIEEVFFHHGIGFKYNFMQPIPLDRSITTGQPESTPARVLPTYYGAILVNEAIGTSGKSTIVELTVDDPQVAGYAVYEGSRLKRAVFVNNQAYTKVSTGERASVKIQVQFPEVERHGRHHKATLKRLVIARADDTANLTWGGVSYETASGLPSGKVVVEKVVPADGFLLAASEAVLLTF